MTSLGCVFVMRLTYPASTGRLFREGADGVAETFRLERGSQSALVSTLGGRVTGYRDGDIDVLAGHEHPDLFAYRGSLLAPWPNRITDGRWTWRGEQLQLPLNDPTGVDAALHGLVVDAEFHLARRTSSQLELRYHLEPSLGYPFSLWLEVSYALTDVGLECALTATNDGTAEAPVGLGVHPYVAAPDLVDELVLTLPGQTLLVTDDQWRETERRPVQDAGFDFRNGRRLATLELDAGFTDLQPGPDGWVEVVLARPDGNQVVLSSGSTCRWLLVYTGHTLPAADRRRSIAIEPMTCPPNALASEEIDVLPPGGSLTLEWRLHVRHAPPPSGNLAPA